MAEEHAYHARRAFAENIKRGEGGIQLADAALLVAAEDDAIGADAMRVSTSLGTMWCA